MAGCWSISLLAALAMAASVTAAAITGWRDERRRIVSIRRAHHRRPRKVRGPPPGSIA